MNIYKESGFTLIELLVTVGIVGIIASLGISQYSEYRKYAYNASAINNVRILFTSFEVYLTDNGHPSDTEVNCGDMHDTTCTDSFGEYGYIKNDSDLFCSGLIPTFDNLSEGPYKAACVHISGSKVAHINGPNVSVNQHGLLLTSDCIEDPCEPWEDLDIIE